MRTIKLHFIAATAMLAFACGSTQAATSTLPATSASDQIAPAQPRLQPESTYYLAPIKGTRKLGKVYVFTRLDRNHDGQLSRSELPLDMVDLRMHFAEADWDRNHRLSPNECRMYNEHTAPQYTPFSHGMIAVFH